MVAHKAPSSMGFSRQEYWSRLPFPFPTNWQNDSFCIHCFIGKMEMILTLTFNFIEWLQSSYLWFTSVQLLIRVQLYNPMDCSTPGFPVHQNSWTLLKLMSTELVMPSNHLILCSPLLLLPSSFPASGLFQWVSSSHQVAKVLEIHHQSFQWIFRIDFL